VVSITPVDPPTLGGMRNPHLPGPDAPGGGHDTPIPGLPQQPGQWDTPGMDEDEPGSGSGFILDQQGNMVTNAHVIGGADRMAVRLPDGRRYTATLVGRDTETDVAVLHLARPKGDTPLPVLPLGDSETVRPGQWTIAVGNPYGLNHSVTVGIVSAVGREGVNLTRYENFIQTDAPINPGNSGGPLFNIHGQVIGITTAIMSYAQGIGFAIPVNMARDVINQLVAGGKVERGWLGIGIQEIGQELAETFNVREGEGVLVNEVFPGQPAEQSGLRPGDIILSLNGSDVGSPNTLARLIAGLRPNSNARIDYLRDGDKQVVNIELGRRETVTPVSTPQAEPPRPRLTLGMDLQSITPELAEELGIEGGGVVVTHVDPEGAAFGRGIREGDVIREINRLEVADLDAIESALAARKPGGRILLRITRENGGHYYVLPAPDAGRPSTPQGGGPTNP
jgi:serine protease Do